jgi:hypothetical protein
MMLPFFFFFFKSYLLKCDANTSPHEWTQIQYDPTYRNYAIMTSSECGRIVVIGNILGGLNIISPNDCFEVEETSRLI